MIDVYNKTVFERNSIQEVPAGYIDDTANNLVRFMGNFWKNIHKDNAFIKGIQAVRGVVLAQFYLNLLETLKLQDRKGMPVFHRELWKPLILRKSERNTAQENILKIGDTAVIGEQPEGSKYGKGTVLQIGRLANIDKYVTYPVSGDIKDIVTGVTNNIVNPSVSYRIGSEFPSSDIVYMNGTLIFPIDKDPFREESEFEVYDVPGFYEDPETGENTTDQETVLWASDVLIDRNYIADHMSYALGISCASTNITKAIINAGWDAINCSLTPEIFRTLLAAMLNIPVIQEESERVVNIRSRTDENTVITTDKHKYTIYKNAVLRSSIRQGAVLKRGEFLDESVKIYPILTDVSARKLAGTTEYADILKTDVPIISVPKTLIRKTTVNGLYVDWTPVEVIDTGDVDKNGHKKVYFDLGGTDADVDAFWEDVWDQAEQDNVDLEELLRKASDDDNDGSSPIEIVPAKFFLEYLIGANTLIVTFDRSQVEDSSLLRNPMFFGLLNRVLPSGMRLFFVEHILIDSDDDEYLFGRVGTSEADAEDNVDKYVLKEIDDDDDEFDYSDLPGMKGKRIPTYEDQIELKMFRNRKRHAE